jgi:hypothetical protein
MNAQPAVAYPRLSETDEKRDPRVRKLPTLRGWQPKFETPPGYVIVLAVNVVGHCTAATSPARPPAAFLWSN